MASDVAGTGTEAAIAPRRRPREGDDAVLKAAAAAFAVMVAKNYKDYLRDATEEEFRDDLLSVVPIHDDDGTELAQALERRHGYPFDADAIEMLGRWGGELSDARDAAVRAWVAETAPTPPFEGVVRVTVALPRFAGEATAYRDARQDARAECLVVPDADVARFTLDGGFSGGFVVPWESVVVAGPARDEDRAAMRARDEREARLARASGLQRVGFQVRGAFDRAVEAESATLRGKGEAELRREHVAALRSLAGHGPDLDPFGATAVRATALLKVLQSREILRRFDAGDPVASAPVARG